MSRVVLFLTGDFDGGIKFAIMLLMLLMVAPRKSSPGRTALSALCCLAGFILTNRAAELIAPIIGFGSFYLYMALNLLFAAIFTRLCLSGARIMLFVLSLFFLNYILFATQFVYMFLSLISGIPFYALMGGEGLASGVVIAIRLSVYLPLFALAFLFRKIVRSVEIQLSPLYWCAMMLAPVMILAVILFLRDIVELNNRPELFCALTFLLLSLNTLILMMFTRLLQELREQTKLRLANQKLQFQLESAEQIRRQAQESRKLRHEVKNKFFTVQSLLSLGRYEELAAYVQNEAGASEGDQLIQTGHQMLDMVLSQKIDEARQKGIPVMADIVLTRYPDMEDGMLCSLLCNLWDNAIEASGRARSPDIHVHMHVVKGYVSFALKNRVDRPVLEDNPNLNTVKPDRESHGFGVDIVRDIVSRAGGDIQFYDQNDYFVVRAMLPAAVPTP